MAHIKTFARPRSDVTVSDFFILSDKQVTAQFHETGVTGGTHYPITYDFQFSHVFKPAATQEDVFHKVAVETALLQQFIQGYNATIFAYGQTASGKSFTVEGRKNDLKHWGVAQRALAYIYQNLEQRKDEHVEIQISYIEIYQEQAYDLLNPVHDKNGISYFPRIAVRESGGGQSFLQNLSCIPAPNEKIGQQLFARAVNNRQVAETSANLISSRSHGIFTLYLTTQKLNSETRTLSKLHIVDLAGSERVSKTKASGKVLREAQSINLSLHYLEQVILALQLEQRLCGGDRNHTRKLHIPYRNSQLTMILRDSLGGNCVTAMIANLHLDTSNLGESISTCRFAQRVALVANFARRNDQVDQKLLIKRLKARIQELENEIEVMEGRNPPLTEEDKDYCWRVSADFIDGKLDDIFPDHVNTCNQMHECMFNVRTMHQEQLEVLNKEASNCEKCNVRAQQQFKSMCTSFSIADTSRSRSGVMSARPPTAQRSSTRQSSVSFRAGGGSTSQRTSRTHKTASTKNMDVSLSRSSDEKSFHGDARRSGEPDDLASIYSRQGKKNGYMTPYDKATNKEIKKVLKAVEKGQRENGLKKEQVKSKDAALRAQQLQLALHTLRHKAQITAEQMADQHAFVLQMKHAKNINPSMDEEDIEQEKLAEFQLKKRLYKLEQKIQIVEQNMDVINQHQQQSSARGHSEQESKGGAGDEGTGSQEGTLKANTKDNNNNNNNINSSRSLTSPVPIPSSDTQYSPGQVQVISSVGNVRVASKAVLKQLRLENETLNRSNQKLQDKETLQRDSELWIKEEQTRLKLEQMKRELKKQEQEKEFTNSLTRSRPNTSMSQNAQVSSKSEVEEDKEATLKRGAEGDAKLLNISSSSESDTTTCKDAEAPAEEVVGVEAMNDLERQERARYLDNQQEMVMNRLRALQRTPVAPHPSDKSESTLPTNHSNSSSRIYYQNQKAEIDQGDFFPQTYLSESLEQQLLVQ